MRGFFDGTLGRYTTIFSDNAGVFESASLQDYYATAFKCLAAVTGVVGPDERGSRHVGPGTKMALGRFFGQYSENSSPQESAQL
jgi:hypothetical protein